MNKEERKTLAESYLGKTVQIVIDRPIGYTHTSKDHSTTYPINFGYIPDVLGGDGEALDVYLLGVDVPVKAYSAKIIGIIYREDDVEDKLVAAPEGMYFDQAEIAQLVHFQEQHYKTYIDAVFQKSCGAVIYRRIGSSIEYLCLLQGRSGYYSVPKGHMEAFETQEQTAIRETYEETGISAELKPDFKAEVRYDIPNNKQKLVVLFLAEFSGQVCIDGKEIKQYRWVEHETAKQLLPPWYAKVIDSAEEYIKGQGAGK